MPVTSSDFYADIHSSRGGYVVKDYAEQAASRTCGKALRKAAHGEGSHGGKIIGHTSSGKPVYANSGEKYRHYDNHFTHADHKEAALMHDTAASMHKQFGGDASSVSHHELQAGFHRNRSISKSGG